MITRFIISFILIAGLAYYFNVDVRKVIDQSGVPEWLTEHGIAIHPSATSTATTK